MVLFSWLKDRLKEPSSYVALGAIVMGVGVLASEEAVVGLGIVGGVLGFLLKEKGLF
tara:strand:- start:2440 stop:2610 length:171 start_codon:yes stop_codon:yes gene_type:complete